MIVAIPAWLNLACAPAASRNMMLRIIAASMLRQIVATDCGPELWLENNAAHRIDTALMQSSKPFY